jgi:DNA-binding NarL/FixJ family response regulator
MDELLTVQLVEDDHHIRGRLVQAIDEHDGLQLMSQTGTLSEAAAALIDPPNIFLVDLGLPDGDGTDLIRMATSQSEGKTKSIVFSVFGDEKRVVRAIEAGASGYLLKDTELSSLVPSIIDMAHGHSPISPAIATHLLKRFHAPAAAAQVSAPVISLSAREIETLEYVAKGFSAREIAEMMGITYNTVVSHTRKIYRKLNVRSRTEAVFEAEQMGLIHLHH